MQYFLIYDVSPGLNVTDGANSGRAEFSRARINMKADFLRDLSRFSKEKSDYLFRCFEPLGIIAIGSWSIPSTSMRL